MNYCWSIKNSTEILNQLKTKGFQASTISTYDFSTLYTTLQHHLIRNNNKSLDPLRAKKIFIRKKWAIPWFQLLKPHQ